MRHRLTHLHHFVQDSLVLYQFFAGPSGRQFHCSKIWCSNCSELPMLLQQIHGDSMELELLLQESCITFIPPP